MYKRQVQYSTEQLRPDIFLILNKEIFFACDAKYKNYSKEFMGIQAWYTDLFECGAYKYIYRLNLGNVTDENSGKCMLPVKKKFVGEDSLKPVLKNGGVCIPVSYTHLKTWSVRQEKQNGLFGNYFLIRWKELPDFQ